MAKTAIEQQFDTLVSHIWTFFKPLGYKKKGNNFRFYDHESGIGKIVNFQKSIHYGKMNIHFTVNIGVYFSDFEGYMWNKKSGENFTEPVCPIRKRLGKLDSDYDKWYDLNEGTNFENLKDELEHDFTEAIRYLDKIETTGDVINLMIIEPSFYPIGVIKTLFYNGQKERALNLLEREMSRANEFYKPKLEKLKQELV